MKTDNEIVTRMRQLEKMRPSIYTHSVFIGLLQLSSFILGFALIVLFFAQKLDFILSEPIVHYLSGAETTKIDAMNQQEPESYLFVKDIVLPKLYLISGFILLFINRLTAMVNRRNGFLMQFVDILDPKENT